MIEYLINVLLGSVGGLVALVLTIIFIHFAMKKISQLHPDNVDHHDKFLKIWYSMIVPCLAGGIIVLTAMSSSITYKHETHDRQQLNNEMYQRNMSEPEIEKKDRMLKPDRTKEERAERFKELTNYK